jgi:3-oxoacyl-[acyl-carrier protein] reductase
MTTPPASATSSSSARPIALVTGVGRTAGIGAAIAIRLARDGWDVATTHWAPYDERMPWGHPAGDVERIAAQLREAGARTVSVADDLTDVNAPGRIFDAVRAELGLVTALRTARARVRSTGSCSPRPVNSPTCK